MRPSDLYNWIRQVYIIVNIVFVNSSSLNASYTNLELSAQLSSICILHPYITCRPMWSAGNIQALWQLAVAAGQSTHRRSPSITYSVEEAEENKIAAALACARDGLYSKACSILTSSCLAFNCEETFAHLKSKHPFRPSSNSSLPIIGQSRSSVSSQSTVCANFSNMIKQQLLVGLRECEFSTSLMQ